MRKHLLLFFIVFPLMWNSCHEHAELTQTPFIYFQDESIVELIINTDIDDLLTKEEDPSYQDAQIILKKNGGEEEHFHLETKPRGVFRKANCAFPPLKIRFPDEVLEAGGFKDYPTLKLVTHCEEELGYDQLIIKEYLTFKLYNVLTDNSFRTQLLKVTYCDANKKHDNIERFGFVIEHPRELADRMNGRILSEKYGAPKNIHKPQYKIFTLFQYMVGNTDWGLSNRHNVKLIQPNAGDIKIPMPVPYDFDFCGLVDAPYAIPHHNHPIKDVKERYFQWRGGEEDFTDVFDLFQSKKEALLDVCRDCKYLTEESRSEMLAYLESFFVLLDTPELIVDND